MKQPENQRKRSLSEPAIAGGHQHSAKLSKPPKVDSLHGRPRKRLQKRRLPSTLTLIPYPSHFGFTTPLTTLYILEYEPYPYNTIPSKFLGVYSTVNSITSGAIDYGAYTFSREGLMDGREYLSPTGRIKIQTQASQQQGTEAAVSVRSQSLDQSRNVRSDIPHPAAQSTMSVCSQPKETVFLAIREGPTAAYCLGVYASKNLAWGACCKNKASCALKGTLSEEKRDVDAGGMPRARARLHGCGQHMWFVMAKEVDATFDLRYPEFQISEHPHNKITMEGLRGEHAVRFQEGATARVTRLRLFVMSVNERPGKGATEAFISLLTKRKWQRKMK